MHALHICTPRAPRSSTLRYCVLERESRRASSELAARSCDEPTRATCGRGHAHTPQSHGRDHTPHRLTVTRGPAGPRAPTHAGHAHGGTARAGAARRDHTRRTHRQPPELPDERISPPSLATRPHSPRAHPTPSDLASTTFRRACGATAVREQCMSSAFLARRSCDLVLLALVLAPGGEPDGPHATCLAIIKRRP